MTRLAPTSIKDVLQSTAPIAAVHVQGWVRTRRDSKDFSFIELNDGSSLRNLQIVAKNSLDNYPDVQRLTTGSSIQVRGALVASQGKGQTWELVADKIDIVGRSDDSYPLQKKGHTPEFSRDRHFLRSAASSRPKPSPARYPKFTPLARRFGLKIQTLRAMRASFG